MTVDTDTLAKIVRQCFENGADDSFTDAQQTAFIADGKRLRGLLMNLLSAQFAAGDATVVAANKQLTAVNTTLADDEAVLENFAATVKAITSLIGSLDKLLNVATEFV